MFYSKSDNKLRKSMFFISLKLFNYFKNSERNLSMLKMLSLIVLHIGIHVQLFKRNPNFTTRVPVNRLVDPHVRVDIHVQMLNCDLELAKMTKLRSQAIFVSNFGFNHFPLQDMPS